MDKGFEIKKKFARPTNTSIESYQPVPAKHQKTKRVDGGHPITIQGEQEHPFQIIQSIP